MSWRALAFVRRLLAEGVTERLGSWFLRGNGIVVE